VTPNQDDLLVRCAVNIAIGLGKIATMLGLLIVGKIIKSL
jgi:hypothetical protein